MTKRYPCDSLLFQASISDGVPLMPFQRTRNNISALKNFIYYDENESTVFLSYYGFGFFLCQLNSCLSNSLNKVLHDKVPRDPDRR